MKKNLEEITTEALNTLMTQGKTAFCGTQLIMQHKSYSYPYQGSYYPKPYVKGAENAKPNNLQQACAEYGPNNATHYVIGPEATVNEKWGYSYLNKTDYKMEETTAWPIAYFHHEPAQQ